MIALESATVARFLEGADVRNGAGVVTHAAIDFVAKTAEIAMQFGTIQAAVFVPSRLVPPLTLTINLTTGAWSATGAAASSGSLSGEQLLAMMAQLVIPLRNNAEQSAIQFGFAGTHQNWTVL